MTQWLRTLVLTKDQDLIPSTYLKIKVTQIRGYLVPPSDLVKYQAGTQMMHIYAYMQKK